GDQLPEDQHVVHDQNRRRRWHWNLLCVLPVSGRQGAMNCWPCKWPALKAVGLVKPGPPLRKKRWQQAVGQIACEECNPLARDVARIKRAGHRQSIGAVCAAV